MSLSSYLRVGSLLMREEAFGMARKRHSYEDCLKILRQVELDLAGGADISSSCRSLGISDSSFHICYKWRKKF